ncbi:MAG: hypothetical protein LPK45_11185, partial [Bacteroidota bacterium]|nr:hypothetical protein [Bacteroidota bacterium]MDX5431668.1 hypothetical protein [Bacteroidota bacterium]MDX5470384.1 hypothetical protein [Bacteroidota bacterium]
MMLRSLIALILVIAGLSVSAQSKWNAASLQVYQNMQAEEEVSLLIQVHPEFNSTLLEAQGIRIGSRAGTIWTAYANKEQIDWMLNEPGVLRLEISGVHIPQSHLDQPSREASNVIRVQEGNWSDDFPHPYTGKDVVLGIIDIGFQPDHPTFFDTTGTIHRVTRYWDQLD